MPFNTDEMIGKANYVNQEQASSIGGQAMRPMNDLERLEHENKKLSAVIQEQTQELLSVYRQLNGASVRDRY